MKGLVIIGVPRCGKSTLATMAAKKIVQDAGCPVSLISGDAIASGFKDLSGTGLRYRLFWRPMKHLFPKLFKKMITQRLPGLFDFIRTFTHSMARNNVVVIFEGAQISVDLAVQLFNTTSFRIVAVACPNITASEKFNAMRTHDTHAWTKNYSDERLMSLAISLIEQSKACQQAAKRHHVPFIDTSTDYMGQIQGFVDNIIEFLK